MFEIAYAFGYTLDAMRTLMKFLLAPPPPHEESLSEQ